MRQTEPAVHPMRNAALALHAMVEEDRTWLLSALTEVQRSALMPLLDELSALGIPADPALLQDWEIRKAEAGSTGASAEWPQHLDADEVARLARVLAPEPPALTQLLLSIHPWQWTPMLLARLDADRRQQVAGAAARPTAPRLRAAILQALQARCKVDAPTRGHPQTGLWRRARASLSRLGSRL